MWERNESSRLWRDRGATTSLAGGVTLVTEQAATVPKPKECQIVFEEMPLGSSEAREERKCRRRGGGREDAEAERKRSGRASGSWTEKSRARNMKRPTSAASVSVCGLPYGLWLSG